jgi:hypothetical protein
MLKHFVKIFKLTEVKAKLDGSCLCNGVLLYLWCVYCVVCCILFASAARFHP